MRRSAWLDHAVSVGSSGFLASILGSTFGSVTALSGPKGWSLPAALAGAKTVVRWLSLHTGVPAVLVAAILVAVGYRVLKRTARFAIEVAAVALVLVAASELGWLRW